MPLIEFTEVSYAGTISVTRPLVELKYHINTRTLPSQYLLIRAITVIAAAIFLGKWHCCDKVVLHSRYSLIMLYNIDGKSTDCEASTEYLKKYPFTFESSLFFRFSKDPNPEEKVYMQDFDGLDKINAQTVSDVYRKKFNYSITEKETGNQIEDILNSPNLRPLEKKIRFVSDDDDNNG
ncbi:hypothetical protein N9Y92_04275, partial [Chlamydiales bacterium]|nr:hypothetical protein [Chlamydiales bacterium]